MLKPDIQYFYCHHLHTKVLKDIEAKYISESECNFELQPNMGRDFVQTEDTLFANTWVGVYHRYFLHGECHGNYLSSNKMFKDVARVIGERTNTSIDVSDDHLEYIPTTDFTFYELNSALEFINKNKKFHLFCNGQVRSFQSGLGTMDSIIENIASLCKDELFVCTSKFETKHENILFSSDILNLENDINEIAFLSTHAKTIVGMNSGPYMFTHIKQNFDNHEKVFLSLSNRAGDSYPAHTSNFNCNYLHHCSDSIEQVNIAVEKAVRIQNYSAILNDSKGHLLII